MFVNERFVLDNYTVKLLHDMEPNFGYNGFGEFIFYRTYSRMINGKQEDWADVCCRVITGMMSIRKDWYIKNHISWSEKWWQAYSRKMAISLFKMEWLAPGRALWSVGTDFLYERGSAASQNCGAVRVDFENELGWIQDMLMLGVGVGFTPARDDKLEFKGASGYKDHEIADSREGWWQSSVALMKAIRYGLPKPRMIYDEIRPEGEPIRGFGGTASGPEPLKELHERIEQFMDWYMTDPYYDSVMLKADIGNCMGVCTVAGNVRRSAELMDGPINDPVFKNLKNYEDPRFAYRKPWGWMSNNATDLEYDEDFESLGEIAERVIIRGEPGCKNLQNFKYGRIGKKDKVRVDRAKNLNPCLTGETKVLLADGRGYVPIKDLEDLDVDVFTIDDETDEVVIRRMRNVRKTGINQKIYKIVFDNGESVRVTGNHTFILRDWTRVQAKDLKYGMQLKRINRYIPIECKGESYFDKYISLGYKGETQAEHILIANNKFNYIDETEHVHHIDENKFNNNPSNLELKQNTEHLSDHSRGESNPHWNGFSNEQLIEFGITLAENLGRRFSTKEWNEKFFPLRFGKYRSEMFKSFTEFSDYCADQAEVLNNHYDTRTLRYYLQMLEFGYETEIIDGEVVVYKTCEVCKNEFQVKAQVREQSFCSYSCSNKKRDYSLNREGQAATFEQKRNKLKQLQGDMYTQFKSEYHRNPTMREWKQFCKEHGISSEIARKGSPFQSFSQLGTFAFEHNHRIEEVVEDGYEDVYNGTVDDFHTLFIGAGESNSTYGRLIQTGVLVTQCGESLLESYELCNQSETCPTVCNDPKKWLKAVEYATMYSSTISLLPTHRPETNRVIARNRRITVGIIDVSGWKLDIGVNQLTKWLRLGYDKCREINKRVNAEAGVPEAIRVTTIKPGGTTPKLPGKTPGIGHPTFDFTLRRVNVAKNSPIVGLLIEAGVPYEDSVTDKYSYLFEWPIFQGPAAPAEKISLWEQAMNLVLMQREWADNAVSNTLYFKPKWSLIHEYTSLDDVKKFLADNTSIHDEYINVLAKLDSDDEELFIENYKIVSDYSEDIFKIYQYNASHEEDAIEPVLSAIAPLTKTVSLLPHSAKGVYKQMPEEQLTKYEYEKRLAAIKKIDWSKLKGSDGQDERYCSGPQCDLPQQPRDNVSDIIMD